MFKKLLIGLFIIFILGYVYYKFTYTNKNTVDIVNEYGAGGGNF